MRGNFLVDLNEANSAVLNFIGTEKFNEVVSAINDDAKSGFMAGLSFAMCIAMAECRPYVFVEEKPKKEGDGNG